MTDLTIMENLKLFVEITHAKCLQLFAAFYVHITISDYSNKSVVNCDLVTRTFCLHGERSAKIAPGEQRRQTFVSLFEIELVVPYPIKFFLFVC